MLKKVIVSLAALALLAGCGGSGSPADEPAQPALAVASSAKAPSNDRTPGPALTAACPLLSPATVAATLGGKAPSATGSTAGGAFSCQYQLDGGHWVQLWVVDQAPTGTAAQAVNAMISRYQGTLEQISGLGDAATFTGDANTGSLVVAILERTRMRQLTLTSFGVPAPRDKLVALMRTVVSGV